MVYLKEKDRYEFTYNKEYTHSQNALAIGADLDLFTLHHKSKKGQLFASFLDRIPLTANPAYEDYCEAQGISTDEKNPIILLGFIGRRGPSSFIFEPVYKPNFSIEEIKKMREELEITQYDFALAFDINLLTLRHIEMGKSQDHNTLKRLQIYFEFPEVALWQLQPTGKKIHGNALAKLIRYFSLRVADSLSACRKDNLAS